MRLGIDFGTTRTVVAASLQARYPIASFDVDGTFKDYLPGVAAVREGELCFGWDAVMAMRGQVDSAVRSIKRLVSGLAPDDVVSALGPARVSALELVTGFLAHVRRMLIERSNLSITASEPLIVSAAVPANASTRQRYLTLEAFAGAGFEVCGLLNEPTAAAVEFASRKLGSLGERSPKRYVVVYDLGGGTFDTSAVSLEGRRFELLDTEGVASLGGDDFDQVLLDMVAREAGVALDAWPHADLARALERCREAKESLNPSSRKLLVDLSADVPGMEPVVIDLAALYEGCRPMVDRTLEVVGALFARLPAHGSTHCIDPEDPRQLAGLYVVGGGGAFPPVGRALRAQYKRKIVLAPQPHAATALGLAICADPDAGVFVREAVTRHFGVWRESEHGHEKIFDRIFSKSAVPPGDRALISRRVYCPTHTIGRLRYLECAALTGDGQPAGDVTPWATIVFPYAPELSHLGDLCALPIERSPGVEEQEIVETYRYERSGSIEVVIENRSSGYERRYTLGSFR